MPEDEKIKIKYSIYIHDQAVRAIRLFAKDKHVSASLVVEAAVKKCIPKSYFADTPE